MRRTQRSLRHDGHPKSFRASLAAGIDTSERGMNHAWKQANTSELYRCHGAPDPKYHRHARASPLPTAFLLGQAYAYPTTADGSTPREGVLIEDGLKTERFGSLHIGRRTA